MKFTRIASVPRHRSDHGRHASIGRQKIHEKRRRHQAAHRLHNGQLHRKAKAGGRKMGDSREDESLHRQPTMA